MHVAQPTSPISESPGVFLKYQVPELLPDFLNYFGGEAKSPDLMKISNDLHLCLKLRTIDLR